MRTLSPHLIATACAVVACAVLPAVAHADPPRCTTRAPVTGVAGQELFLGLGDTCTDADGDQLAFTIVDAPAHGQVAPPDELGFTAYQPDPGFTGDDSFTFRASDGTSDSGLVTVTLTVAPNQPPDCPASYAIKVERGETTSFDPFDEGRPCFDPDGLFLDFAVVTPPSHGTISDFESFGGALYTPEPGYSGPDSFTFTATDGVNTTAPITVSITVLPPNRAPVCVPVFKLRVAPGAVQPLDPKLACHDPDGDPMFPSLVSGPSHGKLGVSPAIDITYTPDAGYIGPDEIAFQMQDTRGGLSAVSRLAIDVAGPVMIPPQPKPDTTAPRLRVTIPAQTLQSVRRRGLDAVVRSDEPVLARLRVSVDRATARRLGLRHRAGGPVRVGTLRRALPASRTHVLVRLTAPARRALKTARRVRLHIEASAADVAGNRATAARTRSLSRRSSGRS